MGRLTIKNLYPVESREWYTLAEVAALLGCCRQTIAYYFQKDTKGFRACCEQLEKNHAIRVIKVRFHRWYKTNVEKDSQGAF